MARLVPTRPAPGAESCALLHSLFPSRALKANTKFSCESFNVTPPSLFASGLFVYRATHGHRSRYSCCCSQLAGRVDRPIYRRRKNDKFPRRHALACRPPVLLVSSAHFAVCVCLLVHSAWITLLLRAAANHKCNGAEKQCSSFLSFLAGTAPRRTPKLTTLPQLLRRLRQHRLMQQRLV